MSTQMPNWSSVIVCLALVVSSIGHAGATKDNDDQPDVTVAIQVFTISPHSASKRATATWPSIRDAVYSARSDDRLKASLSPFGKLSLNWVAANAGTDGEQIPLMTRIRHAFIKREPAFDSAGPVTPGVAEAGFSVTVTPEMQRDDRILLRYDGALARLLRFKQNVEDGWIIKEPEIANQELTGQVHLNSGNVRVLADFPVHQRDDAASRRSQMIVTARATRLPR